MNGNLLDRALSIRQPWAWAILNAGKRIENRSRRFHYRGPICLHASLYYNAPEFRIAMHDIFKATNHKHSAPLSTDLDRGGIIGTANIIGRIEHSDDPWWIGPHGLVLEDVKPVPFIPVKGALGLFKWKKNLEGVDHVRL
jgi:hypothetical protein